MNNEELYKLIIRGIKLESTRVPDKGIINVSSIYNCCSRGFLLGYEHNILISSHQENIPDDVLVTYKLGNVIEDMIKQSLKNFVVQNDVLKMKAGNFTIVGHRDITIEVNGEKYILEVKSIDKDEYDKLDKFPIYKHEFQLKTYLYLAKKNKLGIKKGFLVYVAKGRKRPPIKIFEVVCNKKFVSQMNKFVDDLKKQKKQNKQCETKEHGKFLNCPVVTLCFKEEKDGKGK